MTPPGSVLVVSDDPHLREEAEFGFAEETDVTLALDARDAWRYLATSAPDAVVVDLQTGSAGGFALVRDMKADTRLKEVPALILLEREQDTWLARQAGASAVRVKPLEVSDLVDEVARLGGRSRQT